MIESRHRVRIDQVPTDRIQLVRALRAVAQLSLREAVVLAEHAIQHPGTVLVAGVDAAVAHHIASILVQEGAQASVHDCDLSSPMVCQPQANVRFTPWTGKFWRAYRRR